LINLTLIGLAFLSALSGSPTEPVWVVFSDKGVEAVRIEDAVQALEATYNPRAVERRKLRRTSPGLFDSRDLPLHSAYVEGVLETGADARVESRWLNALSIDASTDQIDRIRELPFVTEIRPLRQLTLGASTNGDWDRHATRGFYGSAEDQLSQINLIALHNAGYSADGVIVGVLDTGFRRIHEAFNDPDHPLDVLTEYDFVNDDPDSDFEAGDPANQADHGTLILGTIGSYLPGTLIGSAYDATFVLCKVESVEFETAVEEDWFAAGLELIESSGGDVATSSLIANWYYPDQSQMDGRTSLMARAINTATDNGVHVCQAVGNDGHDSDPGTSRLQTPADAFEAIAVGAVVSNGVIVNFSSDGPTADGRVKPEVLARGVNTFTVDPRNPTGLSTPSGTSVAAPLVAGAVACLVQAHPDWTVAQMRNALFITADQYKLNGTFDPDYVLGYGIIDAQAANAFCPADINGDGMLSPADFTAWINAFNNSKLECDQNFDGLCTPADFTSWIANFNAGC
jgi:serine protease AprX